MDRVIIVYHIGNAVPGFYICQSNATYSMITYREANFDDAEPIAQLHSLSWQQTYTGILSDDFLKGSVLENRRQVWQKRLKKPSPTNYIFVAESGEAICGFVCAYANEDPTWGTLLDNLHVHQAQKGRGIGTRLIQLAAHWAYAKNAESGFYLWVLSQNVSARRFYENLGAVNQELASQESPDGGGWDAYRYVWPDIKTLL